MLSELHTTLLSAVSPFDDGVTALKLKTFPGSGKQPARPNRTAAVLVPILDTPEPEILLTVRSELLDQHPGQVSFPGGSVDHGDRSAISTALREANEEIGLDFSQVSPLGFLDRLDTNSDFRVLPVVGLIKPSFESRPDHREVSEVFTVPLSLAVNFKEYSHEEFTHEGNPIVVSSLHWKGHRIWGITAAILLNLGHRMGYPRL
jgi:8-oxo-dGTP pyrophosphatase MutT (NUDIX family)